MIFSISCKTVTEILCVTAGLEPSAGHVATMLLLPVEVIYTAKFPVPVDIVELVVPERLPVVSVSPSVQLRVNKFPSSAVIVAVIVNEK